MSGDKIWRLKGFKNGGKLRNKLLNFSAISLQCHIPCFPLRHDRGQNDKAWFLVLFYSILWCAAHSTSTWSTHCDGQPVRSCLYVGMRSSMFILRSVKYGAKLQSQPIMAKAICDPIVVVSQQPAELTNSSPVEIAHFFAFCHIKRWAIFHICVLFQLDATHSWTIALPNPIC